jgi:hypothetical protein
MEGKRTKGLDAIPTIVHSTNEQLRASAIARMNTLREDRLAAVQAADEMYRVKEQECLEAVATWKRAAPHERSAAAMAVGSLQRELAREDEARQSAKYPHRFVQKQELMRTVIDPDTRDMRKIPHPVFAQQLMTTDAADRTILL